MYLLRGSLAKQIVLFINKHLVGTYYVPYTRLDAVNMEINKKSPLCSEGPQSLLREVAKYLDPSVDYQVRKPQQAFTQCLGRNGQINKIIDQSTGIWS